ncbi:hypothetical protein QFC21_000624 [Naganishia friedmannii]|uniref:Uncharacterized protein n=1 Tax=Naganishia friedmannii TaxID=89922 RepID=A0ACC2WD62_9TREE|nr:hypothetical protein QFC21_000624 [Naganishia friedmannii]
MSAADTTANPRHIIGLEVRKAFDSCLLCLYKEYRKENVRKVPPPLKLVAVWFLDSVQRKQEYSEAPYDDVGDPNNLSDCLPIETVTQDTYLTCLRLNTYTKHTTIRVLAKKALFPPSGKGKFDPAYGNAWLMYNKIEEAIKEWAHHFNVDITEYKAACLASKVRLMPDLGPTTYQHFLPLISDSNASNGGIQSSYHSQQQIPISQQQRGRTDIPESVTSMRQGPFSGIERDAYNRNLHRFRIADQRTDDGHGLSSQLQQSSCQTIPPSQSPHQSSQSDLPYHPPPSQQLHIHPAHNWQVPAGKH